MKKTIRKDTLTFYLPLVMTMTLYIISTVNINLEGLEEAFKIIRWIALILLSMKIFLFSAYSKKQLLIIGLVMIIVSISYFESNIRIILEGFLFIIAARNISFKKIVKCMFITTISITLIIISLSFIGIIENKVEIGGIEYNTMGFSHKNTIGCNMIVLCMEYCYLKKEEVKFYNYIIWSIISIFLFFYIKSTTSCIIIILLIIFMLLPVKIWNTIIKIRITRMLLILIVPIQFGISLVVCYSYTSTSIIMTKFNHLTSGRVYWMNELVNEYGLSIFGQSVDLYSLKINGQQAILDNAYLYTMIFFGVLVAALYCILNVSIMKKAIKDNDYITIICVILWSIYGLSETKIFYYYYNFIILKCSEFLYIKSINKKFNLQINS